MAFELVRKAASISTGGEMPSGVYNSSTGAWTLGAATPADHEAIGTLTIKTSSASSVTNLSLMTGEVEAAIGSPFIHSTAGGVSSIYGITETINEGGHLIIGTRGNNTRSIYFVAGSPRVQIGKMGYDGTFTFGLVNNSVQAHVFNGSSLAIKSGGSTIDARLVIDALSARRPFLEMGRGGVADFVIAGTGSSAQAFNRRSGSPSSAGDMGFMLTSTSNVITFLANGTPIGEMNGNGGWAFGPNGFSSANHTISGNVGVASNTSDGNSPFSVTKTSATTTAGTNRFVFFSTNSGSAGSGYIGTNGANAAAFFSSSDVRLKKDIVDLAGALDKILALRPVSFKWKTDDSVGVSFLAQEAKLVLPHVVASSDDGLGDTVPEGTQPWAMTESGFVPYLVKAIQELKAEFDAYVATHP